MFSTPDNDPRCGVAIGDMILDMAADDAGLIGLDERLFGLPFWNDVMELGPRGMAQPARPAHRPAGRSGRGSRRAFLHDSDTITLIGAAMGDGYRIGFGDCPGKIRAARPPG